MKEILLIITLLLAASLPLHCGSTNPSPNSTNDIPECGGLTDRTNPNAPKSIVSEEIVKFHCVFSTLDMYSYDDPLAEKVYTFDAVLDENNCVTGVYNARISQDQNFNEVFETDISFMKDLQNIIKSHDLAQYNGMDVERAGLPDMFGAILDVKYASDEYIYASDNQECFISYDVMAELEELFGKQLENKPSME